MRIRRAAGSFAILTAVLTSGALAPGLDAQMPSGGAWRQWGGPNRNFIADATGLAEKWPEARPAACSGAVRSARGTRPSSSTRAGSTPCIASEGNAAGGGGGGPGPWDAEESVVALDAVDRQDDLGAQVPVARRGLQLRRRPALDAAHRRRSPLHHRHQQADVRLRQEDGQDPVVARSASRSSDSPELLIRPVVKTGYGCSPIAFRDTIICSVGGPGQSVMAFRQSDGGVVWKSGDFLTSEAPPILIEFAGRPQLVIFGGGTVNGLDPANGAVLWSHPHDPGQRPQLQHAALGRRTTSCSSRRPTRPAAAPSG